MQSQRFPGGYYHGPLSFLANDPVVIYSARDIPVAAVPECEQLISELARAGVVLAGGWQSPLEKRLFTRAAQITSSRLIHVLARQMDSYRPDEVATRLIAQGRLLLVAPELPNRRISRTGVAERDRLIRNFVQKYLFCFLDPQGYTSDLIQQALDQNKEVLVLEHPRNAGFIDQEVIVVNLRNWEEILSLG